MVMLRNIMEGRYTFSSPEWDDVTDGPKDLIQKILVTEPEERLTIDEALSHDFFQIIVSSVLDFLSSHFPLITFSPACLGSGTRTIYPL
jgi:serine/threonine protein kinase